MFHKVPYDQASVLSLKSPLYISLSNPLEDEPLSYEH